MYGTVRTFFVCWMLLGSPLLAYAKTPAPILPTDQPTQQASPQQNLDKRGTEQAPLIIKVLPDPKAENISDDRNREPQVSWWPSTEFWLVIFTAVLCGVTGALWWATRNLVKETKRTAKKELRAYVGVERIRVYEGHSNSNIPGKWAIKIRNFGKTMAKDTEVWIVGALGDGKGDFNLGERRSKTVVMPNEAMGFEEDIKMTDESIGSFKSNTAWMYVWGKITYRDVFDKDRWTIFCFKSYDTEFVPAINEPPHLKVKTDGEGANNAN